MRNARERALEELARIARGKAVGGNMLPHEALSSPELSRAYEAIADSTRRRSHRSAYDTGAVEPIEAPPCWLPPVA